MEIRSPILICALVALCACQPEPNRSPANAGAETSVAASQDGTERIGCALSGASTFALLCEVERTKNGGILELTVRHPDGGFRRFVLVDDGTGVTVADGADEAVSKLDGNVLEVAVGTDRYRFPATRASNAARP